ncbi:MAG: penicillin-binding protein 1A [Gammaproteobacteria bacterium]|nr:penicillin-binding protein 1A [Gammaproteobacteria bacterium]
MSNQRSRFIRFLKWAILAGAVCVVLGIGGIYLLYQKLSPDLPPVEVLKDVKLQVPLRIFTADGKFMAEYGEKRRMPLAIEEIPKDLKNAFLAIEDDGFYDHRGVSLKGLFRAAYNLAKTGRKGQGGSTITMQVARNFFLTHEKTYLRKVNEILLALRIEQELNKDAIFELYLNKIYFGNRAYGVGAAAQAYYGKAINELTLAESAMIAGLPKAPSRYNPIADSERALIRRNYILKRMHLLGMIDHSSYEMAVKAPVTASQYRTAAEVEAGYVAEMARAEIYEKYGASAYTAGLNVFTTIDSRKQQAANQALRKGLIHYEYKNGYQGSVGKAPEAALISTEKLLEILEPYPHYGEMLPAVIVSHDEVGIAVFLPSAEVREIPRESLAWVLGDNANISEQQSVFSLGDVIYTSPTDGDHLNLIQLPSVEGALVSLSSDDGAVEALVGGFDFNRSKFNRATQSRRQPGSGFKPFIYSAALHRGDTAATVYNDAPIVLKDAILEGDWRPENYSGKFYGPTRLREGLVKSRNLVSIRVLMSLGLKDAIDYASRFGFEKESMPRNLSLALGSGAVSPLQMASAYAVFANGGYRVEPYWIKRVEDIEGKITFQANPVSVCHVCDDNLALSEQGEGMLSRHATRVIDQRNAFIMRSVLRDVIKRGTGQKALVLKRNDVAGKTGTTNDQRDAWFNGFNEQIVTSVWVGYDDHKPLGSRGTGAGAALPMWIDYMRIALQGSSEQQAALPNHMATVRISDQTGEALAPGESGGIFEIFRVENAPKIESQSFSGTGPNRESGYRRPEQHLF